MIIDRAAVAATVGCLIACATQHGLGPSTRDCVVTSSERSACSCSRALRASTLLLRTSERAQARWPTSILSQV